MTQNPVPCGHRPVNGTLQERRSRRQDICRVSDQARLRAEEQGAVAAISKRDEHQNQGLRPVETTLLSRQLRGRPGIRCVGVMPFAGFLASISDAGPAHLVGSRSLSERHPIHWSGQMRHGRRPPFYTHARAAYLKASSSVIGSLAETLSGDELGSRLSG